MKKIGGFFGLHLPEQAARHNFLTLWGLQRRPHRFFANGRSALHQALIECSPKTLWLPAFCCASLMPATKVAVRFFPITSAFSPDVDFLKTHVQAGDAVLAIDYFGLNPSRDFLHHAASTPGITWIEDRAQAMLPARKAWGDCVIYSPRKLLGVPDGGILVGAQGEETSWNADPAFIHAALLRYEDEEEQHNDTWYAAFTAQENAQRVSDTGMSRIGRHILAATDPRPLIRARQRNYATLNRLLPGRALIDANPRDFVPLGFPLRVRDRRKTVDTLAASGIFTGHYWPDMPSPAAEFVEAHRLAEELVLLPVDHRYDAQDMQRIGDALRPLL